MNLTLFAFLFAFSFRQDYVPLTLSIRLTFAHSSHLDGAKVGPRWAPWNNKPTESGRNLPKKKIIITANVPVQPCVGSSEVGDLHEELWPFVECDWFWSGAVGSWELVLDNRKHFEWMNQSNVRCHNIMCFLNVHILNKARSIYFT